jgi:hypothetical protein
MPDGQFGYDPAKKLFLSQGNATTFAGGIWAYADDQTIYISIDDTQSWQYVGATDTFGVTTICGGAWKEVHPSSSE